MREVQNVIFLQETFKLPKDVQNYVRHYNHFEETRKNLFSFFSSLIANGKYPDEAKITMEGQFKLATNSVIKSLCEMGILNRTMDDYLNNNEGYTKFNNDIDNANKFFIDLLCEQMDSFLENMEVAENSALSQVTGTGVRVFTSSPLTLAAVAAVEYNTTMRQFNKADDDYKRVLSSLSDRDDSHYAKKEKEYYSEVYLPAADLDISMFSFGLMNLFLSDISAAGLFDPSALEYVDFKRSMGLLDNITLTNNKADVLKQSFMCCPFNPMIYQKAIDLGLCDLETYQTSEYFLQSEPIYQYIEAYCSSIISSKLQLSMKQEKLNPLMSIIAYKQKTDVSNIIYHFFEPIAKTICDYYNYFRLMLADNSVLDQWIRNNISKDVAKVIKYTPEQLLGIISNYINSIISNEDYDFLYSIGFFTQTNSCISYNNTSMDLDQSLEQINQKWSDLILAAVSAYINEAKMRKSMLDKSQTEYDAFIELKSAEITQLEKERVALGVFALSKKKALDESISQIKGTIETYMKTSNLSSLRSNFEKMYSGFAIIT